MLARHLLFTAVAAALLGPSAVLAQSGAAPPTAIAESGCRDLPGEVDGRRVVCADIAALDAMLTYNRFGSYNPFGMIFALRRDLVRAATLPEAKTAAECAGDDGTNKTLEWLEPGQVRLRDCKRPRPLVLRANAGNNEDETLREEERRKGDLLVVSVQNLLRPSVPGHSENFCREAGTPKETLAAEVRGAVSEGRQDAVDRNEAACVTGSANRRPGTANPDEAEWPRTRWLNFAVQGLVAVAVPKELRATKRFKDMTPEEIAEELAVCRGLSSIEPGKQVTCFYEIDVAAPYFLSSNAAPSGGEGDGGSITHGLFGAVVVQDMDSEWYRSQVSQAAMDLVWEPVELNVAARLQTGDHERKEKVKYESVKAGIPVLNMLMPTPTGAREIVHSDLNAIIDKDKASFREFSVFFHDELKTFYTRNFEELGKYGQLAGVRDGFAINYGASGMGAMLLANRKGIGPARDCVECLYEEFFLTSWANGDPALLERYADDPSNVHHSYLNDEVRFRNFHAGPKETHVFHLHAHQWFAGNDVNRGAYLDSQTVAPQQGFSYRIYGGGLDNQRPDRAQDQPWLSPVGSGNRNRTVGDSIFHCHLYPHFAQGMWELWRVHDVFEDGTRRLPDGQPFEGLSTGILPRTTDGTPPPQARPGSIDPATGAWVPGQRGTPVPAVVPLPDHAPPVLPTYAAPPENPADPTFLTDRGSAAMPGYPFYIAGLPGHRPPQAPMDIARKPAGGTAPAEYLDGGLPRHVVTEGERRPAFHLPRDAATGEPAIGAAQQIAKALMMGDMTMHLESAKLRPLPYEGTMLERAAMGFHHNGKRWVDGAPIDVRRSDGTQTTWDETGGGYTERDALPGESHPPLFTVNGAPPKPGAPFADPCGAPDALPVGSPRPDPLAPWAGNFRPGPGVIGFRRYDVSAVQLDLVTNRAGWHDPQARIAVLTADSDRYKWNNTQIDNPISPFVSAREEPFFFRAFSGECIEFRHTNELPKELELDDFQVKTPTDTIGQHIHLVKFDVTSSDGSGNGWNYEDGTFAPDEIAARICAAKTADPASVKAAQDPANPALREAPGLCKRVTENGRTRWVPVDKAIWKRERSAYPHLFQTTVQRWFADPIMSDTGEGDKADRTLRTVFSHDHFGPSSIQQHGYYTALIVEPPDSGVCHPDQKPVECRKKAGLDKLENGDAAMIGARRVLLAPKGEPLHPNTREYALAVADFALLYDPRDTDPNAEAAIAAGSPKGIAKLACEARHRNSRRQLDQICGSALSREGGVLTDAEEGAIPAWNAAGRPGGRALPPPPPATAGVDAVLPAEAAALASHLQGYRARAALSAGGRLARPVAPPERPESISVDHHDPYLVNYRGEPMPLRLGTKDKDDRQPHGDCELARLAWPQPRDRVEEKRTKKSATDANEPMPKDAEDDDLLVADARPCSYAYHLAGERGDLSNVFLSSLHGDPATPLIETYSGERTLVRLIQGAQEVQHMFGIEGFTYRRNLDQPFPRGERPSPRRLTHKQRCDLLQAAGGGYPRWYRAWFEGWPEGPPPSATDIDRFFAAFKKAAARCTNIEGNVGAQEIGISEHFEFTGVFRQTFRVGALSAPLQLNGATTPPDAPAADAVDADRRRRYSTDYLYSFGTQDALWNGAWGLVRVYLDGTAPDLTSCMAESTDRDPAACLGRQIKDRLTPLPGQGDGPGVTADVGGPAAPEPPQSLALACDPDAPRARAAVAAVEARRIFQSGGLAYSRNIHDPDGLVLLALEPEGLEDRLAAARNDRAMLIEELKAQYGNDPVEPYVLPVRAGECVELTVVNLLTDGRTEKLIDDYGDARMPPITPLNTTLRFDNPAADGKRRVNEEDRGEWNHGLRPSSRLALQVPLPVMNTVQSVAVPFGYNATGALMPTGAELKLKDEKAPPIGSGGYVRRDATVETITFYAGKVTPKRFTLLEMRSGVLTELAELLGQPGVDPALVALDLSEWEFTPVEPKDVRPEHITIGGRQYRIDPPLPGLDDEQRANLRAMAEQAGAEALAGGDFAHWIPYAFGALPIKSFGDVIGHPAHGLAGAVLVLPCDAQIDGVSGDQACDTPRPDPDEQSLDDAAAPGAAASEREPRVIGPRPTPAGQAVAYTQPAICDRDDCRDEDPARARNFVLFFQDGLNLWDRESRIRWTRADGSKIPNRTLRMQPDCITCDDSYDWGDRAVSYHAAPLHDRLRPEGWTLEADSDLNRVEFPQELLWRLRWTEVPLAGDKRGPAKAATAMPVLRAEADEEVTISVVHPGGRARQRAFITIAQDYDDLFPGFGFPHAALLGPGKSVNAALSAPVVPGCYLWHDGPTYMRANGVWGLLDVVPKGELGNDTVSRCRLP